MSCETNAELDDMNPDRTKNKNIRFLTKTHMEGKQFVAGYKLEKIEINSSSTSKIPIIRIESA